MSVQYQEQINKKNRANIALQVETFILPKQAMCLMHWAHSSTGQYPAVLAKNNTKNTKYKFASNAYTHFHFIHAILRLQGADFN